jgi:hypothetical protein
MSSISTIKNDKINLEIINIFNNNEINDLKKFIKNRENLNYYNSHLIYLFHIIQTSGILITSISASSDNKHLLWIGITLNMLSYLILIFEKINDAQLKKNMVDIQLIKDGKYVDESELIDVYKDITADSNFMNIDAPLLSDFEVILSGMEGSESLMQRLTKYTHGSWSSFLNQPSNVDINKKFIVFSVRDMEDELKPVAMYIVTHYIWNAVRKNIKKRLLVVDEAWWMMKSEDTASFLYSIAKRGRKYYLGLATITQDVGDFMKSPYGIPIVTNSSIQLLLKQSPATIDVLQKTFNLTDEEKYLLLEANVGEGIFFAGLKHVAIKTIASYTEDQIITSDPSQILAIKKAKEDLLASGGGK